MLLTLSPIVTFKILPHSAKALSPIVAGQLSIVTLVMPLHPLKAFRPILATLSGMVILVRLGQ